MLKVQTRDRALDQETLKQEENQERKTGCGQLSLCRRTCPGLQILWFIQGFSLSFRTRSSRLCMGAIARCHSTSSCLLWSCKCAFFSSVPHSSTFSCLSSCIWPNNYPGFVTYPLLPERSYPNQPIAIKLYFLHSDLEVILCSS